jgi:hypothetical protein
MELHSAVYCEMLLLDLICYELRSGRLSPEMEYLFEKHLEDCLDCKRKVADFNRTIKEDRTVRNFG